MISRERARSFDAWAADYDRFRPGYPVVLFDEIAERLELPERPRVADLGAGTGLASLAMALRGWRVTAVEPGAPMLDVLRERAIAQGHAVASVQAGAEDTTLETASVDLVTAAQAFHWFDHATAVPEMARITRPGGGLALFWNVRDAASSDLLAAYNALFDSYGIGVDSRLPGRNPSTSARIAASGAFEPSGFFQVRHTQVLDRDGFIGLAHTKSYVRALAPERLARFTHDLDELLDRHMPPRGRLEVPYIVDCEIARRKDR